MPIEKTSATKMLDTLALRLKLDQLGYKSVDAYLCVLDQNRVTIQELEHACKVLQSTWKANNFPKPSHILEAIAEKLPYRPEHSEVNPNVPQWRYDCARKLGIHVSELPEDARKLTDAQRKILGLPKYWRFLKNNKGIPVKVEFSETPFIDNVMDVTKEMLSEEKRSYRPELERVEALA